MLKDRTLYFGAENVLATAQHHVLGSVDNEDKAILVDFDNVTCAKPAINNGFFGVVFAVEIALDDRSPFDTKLTRLSGFYLVSVGINAFGLEGRHGASGTGRLINKKVGADGSDDAACFGHPISSRRSCILNRLIKLADKVRLQLGATPADRKQAGCVGCGEFGMSNKLA